MKTVHALILVAASVACGHALDTDALRKGEVDADRMRTGVDVVLDGSIAVLGVPLSTSAPDVPAEEFQDEMQQAVSLRLVCPRTGADLVPVEGVWALNEERDVATFSFVHDADEIVLAPGRDYAGTFAIAANDYLARVGMMSLDVAVK